ncbi:MAG: hypothetical protein IJ454_02285 [Clostridia bacterium]|nr:hypothetical protein [Clostridia bacterium]
MTDFERLVIERFDKLDTDISGMKEDISELKTDMVSVKEEISDMKEDISGMKEDISSLKKTAIKTETELIPKTQMMLDNYMSIAEKVNVSNDLNEEVKMLRFDVDLIKQVLQVNNS